MYFFIMQADASFYQCLMSSNIYLDDLCEKYIKEAFGGEPPIELNVYYFY